MVGHEKRKITVCVRRAQTKVQKYNMVLSPLSFVLCPCWNEVLFPVSLSPAVILYSRDIAIVIRIALPFHWPKHSRMGLGEMNVWQRISRVLKWMPGRHRKLCKNRNVNELKTFRDVYGNFITFKRYYCHCRHSHASNSNYFLFNVLKGVRMFGWICTFMFGTQNWISIFFLGSFRFGHNCPIAMVGPKRAMKL